MARRPLLFGRHGSGHGHGHDNSGFEGDAARRYERTARIMRPLYRRIATDIAAGTPEGARVLDIGTGPGRLLVELGRLRPDLDLTGVDPSEEMVRISNEHLGAYGDRARAVAGGVAGLPFPDDSFDLVVTSFSMHHWPDVAAGVAEIARVLRPDGHLGVYDFKRAPFDVLTSAAAEHAPLAGRAARRTRMPSRLPFHLVARVAI
jgi:ubiquinone/menaquinone biosynthesis C-methylase UbiE